MFRNDTRPGVTFEDFLKLRKDCSTMSFFCRVFVSHVVGKVVWRRDCHELPMTKIATVSDEAFALLAVENVWDVTKEKFAQDHSVDQDGVSRPKKPLIGKFTNSSAAGKYGGWSEAGLRRFEFFMNLVREDRAERGAWFDNDFLSQEATRLLGSKKTTGSDMTSASATKEFDIDAFDDDIMKAVAQYGTV